MPITGSPNGATNVPIHEVLSKPINESRPDNPLPRRTLRDVKHISGTTSTYATNYEPVVYPSYQYYIMPFISE